MRGRNTIVGTLAAGLLLLGGCHTVGTRASGIDNFAAVESADAGQAIHRGAQPSPVGLSNLKKMGVRSVIDLRDDAVPGERERVEHAGLAYIHIPTNAAVVDPAKIRAFLDAMSTAPKPVFVHCRAGRDRTGLEIAVYRMVVQGWSRERALGELYAHGYNWGLFPGIARYVKTFDPNTYIPPKTKLTDVQIGG
jgi:uncharacterized protein (TIGR01244 family)